MISLNSNFPWLSMHTFKLSMLSVYIIFIRLLRPKNSHRKSFSDLMIILFPFSFCRSMAQGFHFPPSQLHSPPLFQVNTDCKQICFHSISQLAVKWFIRSYYTAALFSSSHRPRTVAQLTLSWLLETTAASLRMYTATLK